MIREYLDYQRNIKGLSDKTIEDYAKNLRAWVVYARCRGLRWSTLTKQDVDGWTRDMMMHGKAVQSIKARVSALRCLLRWAVNDGRLTVNAADGCETPKGRRGLPRTVNNEDVERAMASATGRTRLAIALQYESGLRIGEVLKVKKQDVDGNKLHVPNGKGGKGRTTYLGTTGQAAVMTIPTDAQGGYFTGIDERRLRRNIETCFRQHMTPHMLRHTFATQLLNKGARLETVSKLLGHARTETTQIYAQLTDNTAEMEFYL